MLDKDHTSSLCFDESVQYFYNLLDCIGWKLVRLLLVYHRHMCSSVRKRKRVMGKWRERERGRHAAKGQIWTQAGHSQPYVQWSIDLIQFFDICFLNKFGLGSRQVKIFLEGGHPPKNIKQYSNAGSKEPIFDLILFHCIKHTLVQLGLIAKYFLPNYKRTNIMNVSFQ